MSLKIRAVIHLCNFDIIFSDHFLPASDEPASCLSSIILFCLWLILSRSVNRKIENKLAYVTHWLFHYQALSQTCATKKKKKVLIITSDFTLHGYYITVLFLLPTLEVHVTSILHKSLKKWSVYKLCLRKAIVSHSWLQTFSRAIT